MNVRFSIFDVRLETQDEKHLDRYVDQSAIVNQQSTALRQLVGR